VEGRGVSGFRYRGCESCCKVLVRLHSSPSSSPSRFLPFLQQERAHHCSTSVLELGERVGPDGREVDLLVELGIDFADEGLREVTRVLACGPRELQSARAGRRERMRRKRTMLSPRTM